MLGRYNNVTKRKQTLSNADNVQELSIGDNVAFAQGAQWNIEFIAWHVPYEEIVVRFLFWCKGWFSFLWQS